MAADELPRYARIMPVVGNVFQVYMFYADEGKGRGWYIPYEGPTTQDCIDWVAREHPDYKVVDRDEFERAFWSYFGDRDGLRPSSKLGPGRPRGGALPLRTSPALRRSASGVSKEETALPGIVSGLRQSGDSAKGTAAPRSSVLELLPGETIDTLIAPVAIAKRLKVPPQYVYGLIHRGKLKTVGERPKKVRIGDVARLYGREVKDANSGTESGPAGGLSSEGHPREEGRSLPGTSLVGEDADKPIRNLPSL